MWRAMNSLLVLRGQANLIAPNRSTASDGLVGDAAHAATTSDHNPHYVAGVGDEIVTALDLTHDPAHGFDSYTFAETLRRNRDPRIKYVISNHRLFSSYATSSYPAWTWRPYSGTDPHTNHVHISVLDAVISDTRTPWNLEGFMANPANDLLIHNTAWMLQLGVIGLQDPVRIPADPNVPKSGATVPNPLAQMLKAIAAKAGMTQEELAALADQIAADVVEKVDVPTAAENAEAVADELHDRTAD